MRRRSLTVIARAGLLLVLVAAGCSRGGATKAAGGAAATSSTAGPVPPANVTVRAHEYGFDLPAEIEGGVVRLTLQNEGKLKHEAVIVDAGDTPIDRLKQDLAPVVNGEGTPVAPYLHFRGGISLVPGGTSAAATLTLPAGKYVLVCSLTDADSLDPAAGPPPDGADRFHFDLGMAGPFTVKTANTAVMPATDGPVVARDWAFDLPALLPGTKTLTFRNDGQQDHSLGIAEFADGIDAASAKTAFDQFLAADAAGKAPPDNLPTPDDIGFAGPLSAGGQTTFTVELKPNRSYVFACYMADRAGGPRHAGGKGMVAYATAPAG